MGNKSSKTLPAGGLLDSPAPPGYVVSDGSITVLELEGVIGLQKMAVNPHADGFSIRRSISCTQKNDSLQLMDSDSNIIVGSSDREKIKTGPVRHEKQYVVGAKPSDSGVILKTKTAELKPSMRNCEISSRSRSFAKPVPICEDTHVIGGIGRSPLSDGGDRY